MATPPKIVILGGGPAGVGAAYQLHRTGRATATLVEQQEVVGGTAGSFQWGGQHLDYGSHRLHAACDPEVLGDIRSLLGDDLVERPRHGRIRLRGRWLHFPLKPLDLLMQLDRRFAFGAAIDMVGRLLPRRPNGHATRNGSSNVETFASVLQANLGPTICEQFYFPYARKIWGREPEELSGIQAKKRVSAGTFQKLAMRLAKPPGAGRFFYPRRGYGQITQAFAEAADKLGAQLMLGTQATRLEMPNAAGTPWRVIVRDRAGHERTLTADHVWSTIPIPLVARMMSPEAPTRVREAAAEIEYRAMVLVYLRLDVHRFTSTDAHYFPETSVAVTRLSEPKNYAWLDEPAGYTTLCAELPCTVGDSTWAGTEDDLQRKVVSDLAAAGLPLERPPVAVHVRRLPKAYPIYKLGYESPFGTLDAWAESLPGFLVYGRQGLFAHDNTHHALYMAYSAVDCLRDGRFDAARWARYREVFATHVVED